MLSSCFFQVFERKVLTSWYLFGITKLHTVKTAISLDDSLMVEADRVAREIGVSRSRLFSLALKHYLEILEKKKNLERLNRVYGSEPDTAETRTLAELKTKFRAAITDRW